MNPKYDGKACPVCRGGTRRMYPLPRQSKARIQHSRWWVCERGHQVYRKKGQQ
jgi:hypothetical protein